jgi:hypothetical protein
MTPPTPKDVHRYDFDGDYGYCGCTISAYNNGDYVLYTDYLALAAERDAMKAERDALRNGKAVSPTPEELDCECVAYTKLAAAFDEVSAERDAAESLVSAQHDALVAMKNERDAWEHRAEVAERENGEALAMLAFTGETSLWQAAAATRAKLAEAEKDAARLDWMADDPPFDGLGDHDLYECWHMVAHENGREEATQDDKRKAFRRLLDHARIAALEARAVDSTQPQHGEHDGTGRRAPSGAELRRDDGRDDSRFTGVHDDRRGFAEAAADCGVGCSGTAGSAVAGTDGAEPQPAVQVFPVHAGQGDLARAETRVIRTLYEFRVIDARGNVREEVGAFETPSDAVARCDAGWPHQGPHRAVQVALVDASAPSAEAGSTDPCTCAGDNGDGSAGFCGHCGGHCAETRQPVAWWIGPHDGLVAGATVNKSLADARIEHGATVRPLVFGDVAPSAEARVTDEMVDRAMHAYCNALDASDSGQELHNAIIDSPEAANGIVVCDDAWMRAALTAALTGGASA